MGDNSALFATRVRAMSTKKPSFEEQLQALETIVEKLEKGDLPLESSLAQFEKGVKLTRECQQLLDQAQQKVTILTQDGGSLDEFSKD
jgi:exodeoxyribonuclease VII small subunit